MKSITIERFYDLLERSELEYIFLWNASLGEMHNYTGIFRWGKHLHAQYASTKELHTPLDSIYESKPNSAFDELLDIQTGHNDMGGERQILLNAAGYSEWKDHYKALLRNIPGVMDTEEVEE